jgi:hypothetical protein
MGFLGKLFGKKEDELGLGEPLGLEEEPAIPEAEPITSGPELPPHLAEPAPATTMPTTPGVISPRDIELINSKLDTLKAILNSMDQRIANLEKAAGVEQKKMPW